MRNVQWKPRFGEARLIFWFKEVGPNIKEYGGDVWDQYLAGPYKRRDPIQAIMGPPMAFLSLIGEGTDQLVAGTVDQKLQRPNGFLGRMNRDGREFLDNIGDGSFIKAAVTGFRLATWDLLLDGGDAAGGFRNKRSYALAA